MKKILAVLLAAALCFCVCACGDDGQSETEKKSKHTCSGEEWVVKEAASCTQAGSREQLCDCGKVVTTETISALGHNYVKGVCATCGEEDPNYVPGPSEGLVFESQGDGTCYVTGMGTCTDENLWIPETSPSGDSVIWVGTGAFSGNTKIKTLTLPACVIRIDDSAFENCTQLTAVYGCEGLKAIGKTAFMGCTALSEFAVGEVLWALETAAFHSCSSLKSFYLPAAMRFIRQTVFYNCTSLTEITIPSNVHTVESSAFRGCTALKEVTVEAGVLIIDKTVFAGCTGLEKLTLGEGLDQIREEAFYQCESLTEVVIPKTVVSLGEHAFAACTKLEKASILNDSRMLQYDSQFDYCPEVKLIIPDNLVEEYRNHSGWRFYEFRKQSAPEVMMGSIGLVYTSNNDGTCYVSGIGTCIDWTVVIPEYAPNGDRVTKIGGSAFEKCSNITKVVIPNSVTEIGASAFMDCSRLESLEIPESVATLGSGMIYGCASLKEMTIRGAVVVNYPEPPMHWEDNTYERMAAIYVPAELVEEYRAAYGWSPFGEKIQAITE